MRRTSYYLLFFVITYLVLFSLVLVANYLVDPYRIFYSEENGGLGGKKPKAQSQIYFNKAVGVDKNKPKTLLLGNSRVQWGLHAGSLVWPEELRPIYNAAIPASSMPTSLAYLEYALTKNNIRNVILGLDYFSFLVLAKPSTDKAIVSSDYLKYLDTNNQVISHFGEQLKVLSSLDTLIDSTITLVKYDNNYSMDVKPNGDNPVDEQAKYVKIKGHNTLFREKLGQARTKLAKGGGIFLNSPRNSPEFDALIRLLKICNDNDIDVVMYIHPYHKSLMEVVVESNRKKEYQDWLTHLVDITVSSERTQLWDFNTNNKYSEEAVPGAGDKSQKMAWYWEPGHYKSTLGELIIERIFKEQHHFGQKLIHNP